MNFGEILSKIESKLVSSYVKGTMKEDMANFKKFVLENKAVSNLTHLYTELDKNQGLDKETAELYITESLRQIEKLLPKSDLSSVSLWIKDVVCENKYKNIDNLVYSMPTTILESVESRKNLISNLTQKPQVKESINLPIETIFNIAEKQLANYIETLDESSKTDLAKVLMTEDADLEIEYNTLKNKTISSLNGVESEDDVTKTKLQETIGQIEKDEYSKINYVRLFALYNNIQ
jgi:hypothetical protein